MPTPMILRHLSSPTGPVTIRQRPSDGYLCLTDLCKSVGKQYHDWRRTDWSQEYLTAMVRSTGYPVDLLVITITTGPNDDRGTWGHPRVALRLAQWCSPQLASDVDTWLEEWLTRAQTPLQELLAQYLAPKPRPWERRFERAFYREIYRVWGKLDQFPPDHQSHWGVWTAPLINRMIYDRHFPPFVLTALRQRNPRMPWGGRRRKHMQLLAADLGDRELQQAIAFTLKFLRLSSCPEHFWGMLDVVAPRHQGTLPFVETFQASSYMARRPA